MKRYGVAEGTREEVMTELQDFLDDRTAQGREDKTATYREALLAVGKGATEVQVGHTLYRVVED